MLHCPHLLFSFDLVSGSSSRYHNPNYVVGFPYFQPHGKPDLFGHVLASARGNWSDQWSILRTTHTESQLIALVNKLLNETQVVLHRVFVEPSSGGGSGAGGRCFTTALSCAKIY